jgi:hypothetical protein
MGGTSTNPILYLYIQDTSFGAWQIDHYENGGVAYGFAAYNGKIYISIISAASFNLIKRGMNKNLIINFRWYFRLRCCSI